MSRPALDRVDCFVGGFALAAIALHDAAHVREGRWYDLLWVCNVAALLVGPGVLLRSALLTTVAFTWILPGTLVWLLDAVVGGSGILPTSWGVHIGGTLAAAYGVRRAGYARHGYLVSVGFVCLVMIVSRLVGPAEHNVNAVHAVPRGWDFLGGSWPRFMVVSAGIALVASAAGQLFSRAIARRAAGG
jgi:hypothetical protein